MEIIASEPQIYPQGHPEVKIWTSAPSISLKRGLDTDEMDQMEVKRIKINTPEYKFQENNAQAVVLSSSNLPLVQR